MIEYQYARERLVVLCNYVIAMDARLIKHAPSMAQWGRLCQRGSPKKARQTARHKAEARSASSPT